MDKSSTFSRSSNQLKEPISVRLQKELELITQSLEFEKREATYLDEQIKLLQFEIRSIPKIKKNDFKELKTQITVNEKKLELEITILNRSKHQNRQLRSQINDYRLDKCAHKQSLLIISDNLDKTSREANDQSTEITKTVDEDEVHQDRIIRLRAKSANQRSVYEEKISDLASMLRNTGMGEKIKYEEKQYAAQSIEVISVLKSLAKTSQKQTVDKKRELDHYLRHLHVLRAGFDHIRSATGISVIGDIVTSCVKSEEQSRIVLFYLNTLNAEVDTLEEKLLANNVKIDALERSKSRGEKSIHERDEFNKVKAERIKKKLREKKPKIKEYNEKCAEALPRLKRFYALIKRMNFKPMSSEKIEVDAVETLNKENCNLMLGNIEEFARFLVMVHELKGKNSLSVHKYHSAKTAEPDQSLIKEILEEKDLYDEPGLEDVRAPISFEEMKSKALSIFGKRKSIQSGYSKTKATTPEMTVSRTPTYKALKDQL